MFKNANSILSLSFLGASVFAVIKSNSASVASNPRYTNAEKFFPTKDSVYDLIEELLLHNYNNRLEHIAKKFDITQNYARWINTAINHLLFNSPLHISAEAFTNHFKKLGVKPEIILKRNPSLRKRKKV